MRAFSRTDRRSARPPFRPREFPPPARPALLDTPPGARYWQERPQPQPPASFAVVLHCPRYARRDLSPSGVEDLITSCPSPPVRYRILSGPLAGRLDFGCWPDALEAAVFLWGRRLDGAHLFTPRLEFLAYDTVAAIRAEEESRLKVLFAGHIRGLLECEAVRRYEEKIGHVKGEIKTVSALLRKHNSLAAYEELQQKRKMLEVEEEQLENRLEEFRAAMECLLGYLSEPSVDFEGKKKAEAEEVKAEIFQLGKRLDWSRIHCLMVRESRRLEEGLPIYACRKKILSHIFANQVLAVAVGIALLFYGH